MLCKSLDNPTDEDVIPKWLLRAVNAQGRVTISTRQEGGESQRVARRLSPKVLLEGGLCSKCNNQLLSRLEKEVKPILEPMAVRREPTTLDLAQQRLLAVWAIKTVYLLELALRQQYPGKRLVEGYEPSLAEVGWLLAELEQRPAKCVEPPPRSMVWLASWDCMRPGADNQGSVLYYATAAAPLPTPDGSEVVGQFTTLAVGFAAFQVFTVDYLLAQARKAVVWNSGPPRSIVESVRLIWPHRLGAGDVTWPPAIFPNDDFDRLANWDGALRRGLPEPRTSSLSDHLGDQPNLRVGRRQAPRGCP